MKRKEHGIFFYLFLGFLNYKLKSWLWLTVFLLVPVLKQSKLFRSTIWKCSSIHRLFTSRPLATKLILMLLLNLLVNPAAHGHREKCWFTYQFKWKLLEAYFYWSCSLLPWMNNNWLFLFPFFLNLIWLCQQKNSFSCIVFCGYPFELYKNTSVLAFNGFEIQYYKPGILIISIVNDIIIDVLT